MCLAMVGRNVDRIGRDNISILISACLSGSVGGWGEITIETDEIDVQRGRVEEES